MPIKCFIVVYGCYMWLSWKILCLMSVSSKINKQLSLPQPQAQNNNKWDKRAEYKVLLSLYSISKWREYKYLYTIALSLAHLYFFNTWAWARAR